MRIKFVFAFLLFFALAGFMTASLADAKVYLLGDFESFSDGDKIPGKSEVWVHNNNNATLDAEASKDKSYPSGGISVRFDNPLGGNWPDVQCIGLDLTTFNLPEEYVLSCYYWHRADDKPPPDFMACLVGGFGWLGLGTRGEDVHDVGGVAEEVTEYVYRDKAGDKLYHSSGVPRKADWVHLAFVVSKKGVDCLIDGKKVYTSSVTSADVPGFFMGTMWDAPKNPVYVDYLVIADTLEEAQTKAAVKPYGKLASTWGSLKSVY
ncbi:MAG: hypothetical protein H8D67_04680 [Deltaproteobacteria bacterium]|nr:hypothetical protein [Deltaproteobacteria bacterium]